MISCRTVFGMVLGFLALHLTSASVRAQEICIYPAGDSVKQVRSLSEVPADLRSLARCFRSGQSDYLARPQDIDLGVSVRKEDINSAVGRIRLRWPRKIESVFGRTPLKATVDAAATLSRTLKHPGFPSKLQNLNTEWDIIFLDAELPETQIPAYLIQNCHPGWMTPPANIYIVAQRIAGQCRPNDRPTRVADVQLTRVLLHEMGHAIEYFLLDGAQLADRARAEGFATWFEQRSAGKSSQLNAREIEQENLQAVRNAISTGASVEVFTGTQLDYARASLPFTAIVDRRGLSSLMRVYDVMATKDIPFQKAVEQELGWNEKRMMEEVAKQLTR